MDLADALSIRARRDDDIDQCAQLLERVRLHDGYPRHEVEHVAMFLGGDELLGAWVALIGGEIVGHVALRAPSSDDEAVERVMALTGCSLDVVTKVARLFSDPARRGRGIGTALLDRATHYAHELRRRPLLDVETTSTVAIALYCSQGWEHVGSRVVTFSSGDAMVLETYLGPSFESGTGPGPTRRF